MASHKNSKTNKGTKTKNKKTGVKGKKVEGKKGQPLNTSCLSSLVLSAEVQLPCYTYYLCCAENTDIRAAFANKLNIKGNITISCSKKPFTDSVQQHLLNHKIGCYLC